MSHPVQLSLIHLFFANPLVFIPYPRALPLIAIYIAKPTLYLAIRLSTLPSRSRSESVTHPDYYSAIRELALLFP